ncbi:hypothetical protein MTO96_005712 [Rhipicephalus appendiculatus]
MMSKPAAGNPDGPVSSGRARAAQPKGNLIKWWPRDTPKMSADDIIVVLKPRETLHLKTAFQTGDLGAAIAQYVGKKQGAPRSKTSKASGNGGASSGKSGQATGPAPANKTSKKDKNRNACGQSVKTPVSQEGDFPSLNNSKAPTTKVSNWAGVAATFSSSPSPLELELKKEISFLQTKNEQLEQKINALQSGRTEPPLPGTLDSGDELASLRSGMGPVMYGPPHEQLGKPHDGFRKKCHRPNGTAANNDCANSTGTNATAGDYTHSANHRSGDPKFQVLDPG